MARASRGRWHYTMQRLPVLALAPFAAALAQDPSPVLVDVAPCVNVESVLERLACYDELARAARTVEGDAAERPAARRAATGRPESERSDTERPASEPSAPERPDRASAEDRFGLPTEPAPAPPDEIDEILSEVAALREILPGRLEITLANGQVWRQTSSDRYRLQVGHPVRIYPSRFGRYYRLTAEPIRGFVQVERVR